MKKQKQKDINRKVNKKKHTGGNTQKGTYREI